MSDKEMPAAWRDTRPELVPAPRRSLVALAVLVPTLAGLATWMQVQLLDDGPRKFKASELPFSLHLSVVVRDEADRLDIHQRISSHEAVRLVL